MKNKINNDYPIPPDISTRNTVSSTDCTGMVPALPNDEDHMDAYTELYDIPEQGNLSDLEDELKKEMNKK